MKQPITVQSHLSFEAVEMRYPEPLSRMHPEGSGAHHRLRCLDLTLAALQHPGSWVGLVHRLRTTGSDVQQHFAFLVDHGFVSAIARSVTRLNLPRYNPS